MLQPGLLVCRDALEGDPHSQARADIHDTANGFKHLVMMSDS